jgi:hypothetical protein
VVGPLIGSSEINTGNRTLDDPYEGHAGAQFLARGRHEVNHNGLSVSNPSGGKPLAPSLGEESASLSAGG